MDQAKKDEIVHTLESRGAILPCPRCGNRRFSLVDGYFSENIQKDLNTFQIGGPSIPTVVTVCNRCGFLSKHALGVLNLLPTDQKKEDEKNK